MPSLEKKGWFWEDTLIEESVPEANFSVSIDETFVDIAQLSVFSPGFIHLDMKMWMAPFLQDDIGSDVEVTGLYPGNYEVCIAYFESNGAVGQIVVATQIDGNPAVLRVPGGMGAGTQVLKMNAYILPFTNDMEYVFNDKAQGINIYLRYVSSEGDYPGVGDDLLHICELNFEKGWRKIGDAVGASSEGIQGYNPFLEIEGSDYIAPGIVSFTGLVGNTPTPNESWTPFIFYSQPMVTFYSSHGFNYDGLDKYRFKTAVVHKKRSWVGNVAKVKTLLDDEGQPEDNWGSIFEVNGDRVYKSAVRVYEEYPDSNWIDVVNSDGDEVVVLQRFGDFIFQFKKNKTFIISTAGGVEALVDTLDMGVNYDSSTCITPHGVCFFNKKGGYLHTGEGYVNLSKDKLDMEEYWYDNASDYYDVDYFVPAIVYSPVDDKIVLFLQTFGEGITLDYLKQNPQELVSILGIPDNTDTGLPQGMVNDFGVEYGVILDQLDSWKDRTKFCLFYSFTTAAWTTGSDELLLGHKTNAIEYKGNIYIYNAFTRSLIKWNNSSKAQSIDIQTGFNTFQYPSMRKKIKNIALSWKMNKLGIGTSIPYVEIMIYKNKSETPITLSSDEIISGLSFSSSKMKLDPGSDEDDGTKLYISKLKLPSGNNNVYSLSIRLKTQSDDAITDKSFELDDISVTYQYMGVK